MIRTGVGRAFPNLIGVDDAPFAKAHRGDVPLVGAVYATDRLDGVIVGKARRDGRNGARELARMIRDSRFDDHIGCVLLQGITVAGFNVVDLHELHERIERPILVVTRKAPNLRSIERALRTKVPGGDRKWKLIQAAGPMEPCGKLFIQRVGLTPAKAAATLELHTRHGLLPEPLRVAHLLAAAHVRGHSHGSA
ncbi:MAG: DUF99 family protein [Deltaproteobacteria bacterium]|nr:DUF99 family protein [Deltaproteobacteria bacterium]